LTKKLQLKV